ncbi:tetratricopeptide repeat protein [Asticcacaulis sp. 201]|uniref:tetratricopeptide repeat protein n=1 Tax=Asticcacaulis sp. 201 TaxID=3028787 RepID=UPI0029170E88|nr:tetratricopeptide repeat protein [Asticcacaulis sp. 201]MDV6331240.1 tetratricopeptide repeat protein [Asticcacaulis sp. 201]
MRFFYLILALWLAPSLAFASSNFTRVIPPGPYAVGLKVVTQYDYSRGYGGANDPVTGVRKTGERARPIQTLIWYPAEASGAGLTLGDYLKLGASDDDFELSTADRTTAEQAFVAGRTFRLSKERALAELTAPMLAHADASPASGKFPVVVYAPSFSAWAFENADLCEFLASQGYVVIASPSLGANTREMTTDVEGIEAQAADIGFLISYAHSLPQADTGRIGVIGYSWGGIANVFAAAKDGRINALVALDGSVRYWPDMIAQAKYVTPARVTAPLLYLAARPKETEHVSAGVDEASSFLTKMIYADVYRVTLNPLQHPNFSSVFDQRLAPDDGDREYDKDEMSAAYGWLETYVVHYLDAYLKGDATGLAFLRRTPRENGTPAHMVTSDWHAGAGSPPTREALAVQAAKSDFTTIEADYQALKARAPDFSLSEGELNDWGYRLLAMGRARSAVSVFKLAAKLYPTSGNAFDSLGEAYAKNGQKAEAVKAYTQSLQLDPTNSNAKAQLEVLAGAKTK